MKSNKPIIHGRDHAPGGADPIPGLVTAPPSTFYDAIFAVADTSDLRGYWRLGDGGLGPYADSKPASLSWANAPMVRVAVTIAMTDIATGALPAAQDDGAVQFNDPTDAPGTADDVQSDYLKAPNTWGAGGTNPFQADISAALTVMGWVNPSTSASIFDGGIFSMASKTTGTNGYVLGVAWPSRSVFFQTYDTRLTGPILTAGQWTFVCAVHDTTSNRIYLNGALVVTGTPNDPSPGTNVEPLIGLWNYGAGTGGVGGGPGVLYGAVDEVVVFGTALTDDQIATLWGTGTTGGGGPPLWEDV